MNQWITAADVRTFANIAGTTGRYSDAALGSNILTAQSLLQRRSGRQWETQTALAKTFDTEGAAQLPIPDLLSATSVTLNGAALVANESYWLIEDTRHSGVFVAIQLRVFEHQYRAGPWYLANSEWFDRGLDLPPYVGSGTPNDLVITGTWGWSAVPYDVLHATKVLAGWLTKRGDALLANAVQLPDGSVLDYSSWPPEAQDVVREYARGAQAVVI